MKTLARPRRPAHRLRRNTLKQYITHPPPAPSAALRALYRATGPPRVDGALAWVRASGHASILAGLAEAFLNGSDALAIERFLRAGDHEGAAKRFCERFSDRQFPLDYAYTGRGEFIVELTSGIQHEGWGENWEQWGDLWALKPVFLLSWALTEDPYPPDDDDNDEQDSPYRHCDEARDAIAQLAEVPAQELFDGVPPDGFPSDHLSSRFAATQWEPLLWAAPWLWRLTGNPFLDRDDDDYPEAAPWSVSGVFSLTAQYREALRIMRAIDGFNTWLEEAPGAHARAAVQAARRPPSSTGISTLLDPPIAHRHDECSCPHIALAS